MDICKNIKKASTRVEKSITELEENGYSNTGISNHKKPHKEKRSWTKETAIMSSFLWPNQIVIGHEPKREEYKGYHLKVNHKSHYAKALIKNNINTVNFRCVYCPEIWDRESINEIKIFLKSEEKAVIDSAKDLAALVINREMSDVETFVKDGEIYGRIMINNGLVEYAIFRNLHLFVDSVITEVIYKVDDHYKIRFIENIDRIDLCNIDNGGEDAWKSISFEYKEDTIADNKLVDNIKREIFEKVQKRLENKMNMFRGYNIWHIREAGHLLETYWVNPEYKYLKIIISLTLERKVEDTRYGVLFKLA